MISDADIRSGTKTCEVHEWLERECPLLLKTDGDQCPACTSGRIPLTWEDYRVWLRERGWTLFGHCEVLLGMNRSVDRARYALLSIHRPLHFSAGGAKGLSDGRTRSLSGWG